MTSARGIVLASTYDATILGFDTREAGDRAAFTMVGHNWEGTMVVRI